MTAILSSQPLGDVVTITKGRKPPRLLTEPTSGGLPYATANFFRTGKAEQFVPSSDLAECVITPKGCTIIIWDGSNAGEVFVGKDAVLASTMAIIKPIESIISSSLRKPGPTTAGISTAS